MHDERTNVEVIAEESMQLDFEGIVQFLMQSNGRVRQNPQRRLVCLSQRHPEVVLSVATVSRGPWIRQLLHVSLLEKQRCLRQEGTGLQNRTEQLRLVLVDRAVDRDLLCCKATSLSKNAKELTARRSNAKTCEVTVVAPDRTGAATSSSNAGSASRTHING